MFLSLCQQHHIDTIEIRRDSFEQSNCRIPQLIIHKFEDDDTSRYLIERIRQLPKSSITILDEFESIARLLDRYEQYSTFNCEQKSYHVPPFIRVTAEQTNQSIEQLLKQYKISFPILCKPMQAHGDKSHDMKIIFDVEHLNDIDKPCVLQQFIDHDGILFKVFAIGENNYHIVQRNSIRNLSDHSSHETISFHSSEVSSSQAAHHLISIDRLKSIEYDEKQIHEITRTIQKLFRLNLIGIDIIIDRQTRAYAVIDVNYFPGYESVNEFSQELFDLCQHLLSLS